MLATGWHNGGAGDDPAAYGLKFFPHDRDKYFDPSWESITLSLDGGEASTELVDVDVPLSTSFWRSGRELRSAEVGQWLLRQEAAPWLKGSPPSIVVTQEDGNRFSARILRRRALG
ncbi:MAG TPA: hypothetical protein VM143_02730 [Acidimicrobiales bacterium]|nr:hypothetical protein [Acidimicrobiales bacterium]